MNCGKCGTQIEPGEEREINGKVLCEDCAIDVLSPPKTCDPWAVHLGRSSVLREGSAAVLSPLQSEILMIVKETGGIERSSLLERFDGRLTLPQLEREFATLRHMEKVKAEKKGELIFIKPW